MLKFFKLLSINPITRWIQWLLLRYRIRRKNKTISLGYMAKVENCKFSAENHIFHHAKLFNVSLGNFTYIGGNTSIKNASIGHFTSIASDCRIGLGIHPTHFVSTHPIFYAPKKEWSIFPDNNIGVEEYKKIDIGNDVWIGTNVIIVDGVSIGNGSIIAAGAVVTKNVAPYSIMGGVPAKLIKYRLKTSEIEALESIKWWNWNIENINKHKEKFISLDSFINHFFK